MWLDGHSCMNLSSRVWNTGVRERDKARDQLQVMSN